MATIHKVFLSTNHINNQYHNFREHIRNKFISVHSISIKEQLPDIFTKPLYHKTFSDLIRKYINW